jgi:peptidoglycan-associated lipoprotein
MKKTMIIFASLLIAACSSTTKPNTAQTEAPTNTAVVSANESASKPLSSETQSLQTQSVYFDFDESAVKPAFKDDIQKQAAFMKAHKNEIVTLEGNCDERGSAEYNLALGQRRADAVKKLLLVAGIRHGQIKAASEGKEKPRLACHEEKCWKENRRVDFVYGG